MSTSPAPAARLAGLGVVVTGGGRGIGKAITQRLAEAGANVVIASRKMENLQATAQEFSQLPGKIHPVECHVGRADQLQALIGETEKVFGPVDILVNNSATNIGQGPALDVTDEMFAKMFEINVVSALRLIRLTAPKMIERKSGGSIINTASFVAVMGAATPQIAYTTSKGAVLAMTRELAMVHAREGIRVNSLCPGPLQTPLLMDFLNTPEKLNRRLNHLPIGRFGEAIEQARAALFLASDDASYVTGHDMLVDGGLSKAYVTAEGQPILPPPSSLV